MNNDKYFFEPIDDEILSTEILEFAREYQSADFPNPHRQNCPSNDELLEIATSINLPEPELRQHFLNCSPCFNEFQKVKKSAGSLVSTATDKKESWFSFFLKPLPVAICLLILSGIITLAAILWFDITQTEIVQNNAGVEKAVNNYNNENPVSLIEKGETDNLSKNDYGENFENRKESNLENSKVKSKEEGNRQNNNRLNKSRFKSEYKNIKLDLAKNTVLRNENTKENSYSIPAENVSLNIKLIRGSPSGTYEILLLDEFGTPLNNAKFQKSNGKNLKVNFDFRNRKGQARLCIAPKGEIPDCFPIKFISAKPE